MGELACSESRSSFPPAPHHQACSSQPSLSQSRSSAHQLCESQILEFVFDSLFSLTLAHQSTGLSFGSQSIHIAYELCLEISVDANSFRPLPLTTEAQAAGTTTRCCQSTSHLVLLPWSLCCTPVFEMALNILKQIVVMCFTENLEDRFCL